MLTLYNSLTNTEEEFTPLIPGVVTMYTCGPTVYGRPHIGNYSSFLMADLLRRWLEVSGYEVRSAKNITDVGHLVADADDGEDKVQKQAAAEKLDPLEVARKYTDQYLADEQELNILEPTYRPKATETITEQLDMIQTLLEQGNAYETEDGYYFAVESFATYGNLSGNTLNQLHAGARIEVDENKKHPADFALWKKCVSANNHHILRWSFATGERVDGTGDDPSAGFPGWHIECSAMARAFLGDQIDIHTGGEDLIFPHHECEVAQSECCTGKQFVQVWLHKRFIDLGDTKMSKSTGNVLGVHDIVEQGFHALDIRYYLLSVHYRTQLKFTWEGLEGAKTARRRVMEWISEVNIEKIKVNSHKDAQEHGPEQQSKDSCDPEEMKEWKQKFTNAMNADLNTPEALAVIFDCMTWSRTHNTLAGCAEFVAMIQHTFGCFDTSGSHDIPADVAQLVDERAVARTNKDFAESDRLRDAIAERGYEVRDTSEGQVVKKL